MSKHPKRRQHDPKAYRWYLDNRHLLEQVDVRAKTRRTQLPFTVGDQSGWMRIDITVRATAAWETVVFSATARTSLDFDGNEPFPVKKFILKLACGGWGNIPKKYKEYEVHDSAVIESDDETTTYADTIAGYADTEDPEVGPIVLLFDCQEEWDPEPKARALFPYLFTK